MSSLPTGSWFDAEAQSLRDNITEYGELFTHAPYRTMQVNFPTSPDTTRQPLRFWAVFERDAKDMSLGMQEVRVSTRHLCLTALVCDAPDVRQGDRVTHVPGARWGDMTPGELFELTDVRPDGLSGVEMRMTQLGRAKQ
jgi:hypothetical protein